MTPEQKIEKHIKWLKKEDKELQKLFRKEGNLVMQQNIDAVIGFIKECLKQLNEEEDEKTSNND